MCGIWLYLNLIKPINDNEKNILFDNFIKTKSRGPNNSSFEIYNNNAIVGFHRLKIMDLKFHSNQPYILEFDNKTIIFICNGEIYNYEKLIKKYKLDIFNNSDCLVIPKLYIKFYNDYEFFLKLFIYEIIGEYSFYLLEYDENNNFKHIVIGRDHVGIRPLYTNIINKLSTEIILSSEIKSLVNYKNNIIEHIPGNITTILLNNIENIVKITNYDITFIYNIIHINEYKEENYYLEMIRRSVINSIKRRLKADVPIGFLLSGGVDSSLVCSISNKILNNKIKTYCCGIKNGTDLNFAKKVADYISSEHKEVLFDATDAINSIKNVIYAIESWDITTIRASIGQYLISKYISENTQNKVLLVGEGPDEVCSSYLFNYYAPVEELHDCCIEFVKNIHLYDGRRADRCAGSWGLEVRIPFLDPEFISSYWAIPPKLRHPKYKNCEKWWLRKAFESTNLLPQEVLWRKKEAFSDGISDKENSLYGIIQEYVETLNIKLEDNVPTKEAQYYKNIFINYFGSHRVNILKNYWQPKWISKEFTDPSARTLDIY